MKLLTSIKTRRGILDFSELNTLRKRFARYARPHWKALVVACLATLGAVAMGTAAPWPLKFIFDIVLTNAMAHTWIGEWFHKWAPQPGSALLIICGMIIVIALIHTGFVYLRDVLLAQTGQKVVGKLRQNLFAHMQRLSPDVFESRRTGDLLMRLTGDIQMLRQILVNAWVTAGENVLMIVAVAGMMFWLNPLLAAMAAVLLPVVAFATWKISSQLRQASRSQREKESFIASIAGEVIGAMTVVQAYNREKIEGQRFSRQNRSSIRAGVRMTRLEARLFGIITISSAATMCAVLYVGVNSVLGGHMTPGDLLVFVSYMRSLSKPVRKLSKIAGQAAKATTCGLRIAEILAIPPSITDRPDAVPLQRCRGEITLDYVDFVYPNGAPALQDFSLRIAPGERVAIVGESGAGKSTVVKLLLRFYDPTAGWISIDGRDIRSFTVASLRNQIAFVQQETVLFGLTVAENIALGCEEIDLSAVQEAALTVGADEFIRTLPDGYQTLLSERGTILSGGQRQRISLARAILRNTPILVLDEPATGLDSISAGFAERSWLRRGAGRTTIVICHELKSMDRFDRIVVLGGGRVVDTGSDEELRDRCGTYMALQQGWQESLVSASGRGL